MEMLETLIPILGEKKVLQLKRQSDRKCQDLSDAIWLREAGTIPGAPSPLGLESIAAEKDGRVLEPAIGREVEGKIVWNEIGFSDLGETAVVEEPVSKFGAGIHVVESDLRYRDILRSFGKAECVHKACVAMERVDALENFDGIRVLTGQLAEKFGMTGSVRLLRHRLKCVTQARHGFPIRHLFGTKL